MSGTPGPGDPPVKVALYGRPPAPLERPATRQELADLLRGAAGPVIPLGRGTWQYRGLPVDAPEPFVIQTTALQRIVDFQPDDLTVTVEPGVTLEALEPLLAGRKLRLALGRPEENSGTIGGIVATAADSAMSTRFGSPRRQVIGITVMDGSGVERRAGGRLVKNVAGYDLMKLHTGAWGTLGLITEITLRLHPRPEAVFEKKGHLAARGRLAEFCGAMARSPLQPAWFRCDSLPEGWNVRIGFEGFEDDVQSEARLARQLRHATDIRDGLRTDPRPQLAPVPPSPWDPPAPELIGHVHAGPAALVPLLEQFPDWETLNIAARPLTGRARLHRRLEPGDDPAAIAREWRGYLADRARLVVETTLGPILDHETALGPPPAHLELMRGLKQALDPERRFNPGRYFWGL